MEPYNFVIFQEGGPDPLSHPRDPHMTCMLFLVYGIISFFINLRICRTHTIYETKMTLTAFNLLSTFVFSVFNSCKQLK